MTIRFPARTSIAAAALVFLVQPAGVSAAPDAGSAAADAPAQRDGQHDFDFLNGRWHFHLKKLEQPLSDSDTWIEYDGTARARSIMGGRGQIDEYDGVDAETHKHIGGMTLRLYDRETHLWRLYAVSADSGSIPLPPDVGRFDDHGRGEFYDYEVFRGRPILVRYLWTDITADSARFEQAFSADQGRTWETNWIYTCTRL